MAMDALKNLVNNIPYWIDRLTKLRDEIDLRQIELAAVAAAERKSPETKSLRNKGSTESLKPNGDPPEVHAGAPTNEDILEDANAESAAQTPLETPDAPKVYIPSPGLNWERPRLTKQARARVRATLMMMSNEEAPTAYRERTRIIVYYDGCVQGFFDELVRFVSSCGNLICKAQRAARVAQVKKLAKQDVPEDGKDDEALPWPLYMSSRRLGPTSTTRPGAGDQPLDVYYKLGKDLEFVQSMCEHGAHQVLCKGVWNDKIRKARKRLKKVFKMAKTEMKRVQREEPEFAKETGEMGKARIQRPILMRRRTPTKEKNKLEPAKLEAAEPTSGQDSTAPLAVDPDPIEADEGIDVKMENRES